jgi:hypothetical protein
MAGGVRMALGSLMLLVFRRNWLAASMLRLAETLNYPNQIRGRDGQAFPLPSESVTLDCGSPKAIPTRNPEIHEVRDRPPDRL